MPRKLNKERNQAEVNMTPMLDIVFIMLIFFIVTTTFMQEFGMDVTQPNNNEEENPDDNNAKAIVVQVCANEQVSIDQRPIDVRSVRANVERKLAEDPLSSVIIQTEKQARTGLMIQVMDQAREAKASVSLMSMTKTCTA